MGAGPEAIRHPSVQRPLFENGEFKQRVKPGGKHNRGSNNDEMS